MTELERLLKAKIPGERTGIEIRHSLCAICSPGHHCGLDCYVKDGVILKVEGTPDHPYNRGKICSKGVNNRQYVYRADRIRTPLRRVGERGEGKFEPVSWEEAYTQGRAGQLGRQVHQPARPRGQQRGAEKRLYQIPAAQRAHLGPRRGLPPACGRRPGIVHCVYEEGGK